MNILAICGSQRDNSNSGVLLSHALKPFKEAGCEVRQYNIGELNINSCTGCEKCIGDNKCVIQDDMTGIVESFFWADGIIIASPVFYRNIPSKLIMIMERIFSARKTRPLEGKPGGAIAVGRGTGGGQSIVLNIIHNWMLSCGVFCVPGELNGVSAAADHPGDILLNEKKLGQAEILGENILKIMMLQNK